MMNARPCFTLLLSLIALSIASSEATAHDRMLPLEKMANQQTLSKDWVLNTFWERFHASPWA